MQDTALSAKIAKLNDAARRSPLGYLTSAGVVSLPPEVVSEICTKVYNFKDFTEDSDPYGEHDFGSLVVADHKVFWKIDYYDSTLKNWCDPLDPKCRRVVTIMLAEEY